MRFLKALMISPPKASRALRRTPDKVLLLLLLGGCVTPGLPGKLPPGSPAQADSPASPPSLSAVLAKADPLAWPPLAPVSGGGHGQHGGHR
jgi:hypothetical protein